MIRDDYGCDWLIESRRQRWRYILDRAFGEMIRDAYKAIALTEMRAMYDMVEP